MLGDKQQQAVEGGSTALQAGRDINVHGLSVSEVRELCGVFLRDNFPKLREEAKRAAEEHVREFAMTLEGRLVEDAASIALERFREPDVQAAINDAVQASARKGSEANPQILSTLISERVAKHSNSFKDIVLSEAVHVVPRLTSQQIALLSFVHFARSVLIRGLPVISALEKYGRIALQFSSPGFGMSDAQKMHLQYAGVASVNRILGGDIYETQSKEYSYFGIDGGPEAFKRELSKRAPSYLRLLDQFAADNLFAINLTSVGQAIAIANISNHLGRLDYTIWLK